MRLSRPEEHYKAAQVLIVEGFGILQEHHLPAEVAGSVSDSLLKAGEKAGEVAVIQMIEQRAIPHELDQSECQREAESSLGRGIELMARGGVPEDAARRVVDLFVRAGQESCNYRWAKAIFAKGT